jgi:hypothetical protein
MNRTIKRLILMMIGIMAIVAGVILTISIVAYWPLLMIILCVGLILVLIWMLTGEVIE